MNAAEFLKLVEEHPLPWFLCCDDKSGGPHWYEDAASGAPVKEADCIDLGDAAPAMAAAIIRLISRPGMILLRQETPDGSRELYVSDMLRASLPESLRP